MASLKKLWEARISIFFILFIILVYEWSATWGWVNANLIPPPSKIWTATIEWIKNGEFERDLLASSWRVSMGLCLGVLGGVLIGVLTGRIRLAQLVFSPLLNLTRSFPPVALLPVFITILGIGDTSKILSIALACFFPVWVNAHIGAQQVPQEYIHSANLVTKSQWRIFRHIILPSATPFVIGGIRLSISMSFIMLYVSELAGASAGLGYEISSSHLAYRMDKMFAALFTLGFFAAFADYAFNVSIRRIFPWVNFT